MEALRDLVEDGVGPGGFVGKFRDSFPGKAEDIINEAYAKIEALRDLEAKAFPSDWEAFRDLVGNGSGSGGFVGKFRDSMPDLRAQIDAAKGRFKEKAEDAAEEAKAIGQKVKEGVFRDKVKWLLSHRYGNESSEETEEGSPVAPVAPIDNEPSAENDDEAPV